MKADERSAAMDTSRNAMKSMRLYDRVERLVKELGAAGLPMGQALPVPDPAPFDPLHYCGTSAVDRAIRDCGIAAGDKVIEIGSGGGGGARGGGASARGAGAAPAPAARPA